MPRKKRPAVKPAKKAPRKKAGRPKKAKFDPVSFAHTTFNQLDFIAKQLQRIGDLLAFDKPGATTKDTNTTTDQGDDLGLGD